MSAPLGSEVDAAEGPATDYPGLPRPTIVVAAVAIALAVAMTFVILKWSNARAAAAALRAEIVEVDAKIAALRPELTGVEGALGGLEERTELLGRGKLSVCNYSGEPVTVKMVAATWLDSEGRLTTFNSSEKGLDLWRIAPGERVVLDHPPSGWDGSATYYSLWLRVRGQEYPYAGTRSSDGDDCSITWT